MKNAMTSDSCRYSSIKISKLNTRPKLLRCGFVREYIDSQSAESQKKLVSFSHHTDIGFQVSSNRSTYLCESALETNPLNPRVSLSTLGPVRVVDPLPECLRT